VDRLLVYDFALGAGRFVPMCYSDFPLHVSFSLCAHPATGSGRAGLALRSKPRPFVLSLSKQKQAAASWIKIMWNPYKNKSNPRAITRIAPIHANANCCRFSEVVNPLLLLGLRPSLLHCPPVRTRARRPRHQDICNRGLLELSHRTPPSPSPAE
jgi:hypothetical protein